MKHLNDILLHRQPNINVLPEHDFPRRELVHDEAHARVVERDLEAMPPVREEGPAVRGGVFVASERADVDGLLDDGDVVRTEAAVYFLDVEEEVEVEREVHFAELKKST